MRESLAGSEFEWLQDLIYNEAEENRYDAAGCIDIDPAALAHAQKLLDLQTLMESSKP
jgi:hypothetical protein